MKFLALLILLVALVAVFGQTTQPVNNHVGRYRRAYGHTLFDWYFGRNNFGKRGRSGHKSHSHESRSDESSTISHSSTATITINGTTTTATPSSTINTTI